MLVNCKVCGKEIAKDAKKCVHCGADQRNFFSKHKILTGILALFVIGIIGAAFSGRDDSPATPTSASPTAQSQNQEQTEPKNKPTISKAEFDKIQGGMSYEEVAEIIGGPGEVMSESGSKGDQFHTVMYTYQGEGSIGANANFLFQGNQLQNKAQLGLK